MRTKIFKEITSVFNEKPVIIAEMSGNHGNNLDTAKKFVDEAIAARADIIKFQVYTPDTITLNASGPDFQVHGDTIWSEYKTLYDLYSLAHTPWDWVAEMAKKCDEAGQPWFASPFDETAVNFLESINCPAYKLASPEINDFNLVEVMARTGKPIIVSTGLASEEELDAVVDIIKNYHNDFALLKCTSAYPAPLEDLNLKTILYLKDRYQCPIGFSDHSKGDTAAIVAIACGATVIEKHFKLDDDLSSVDAAFSMNISDLPDFKQKLFDAKSAIGNVTFDIPISAQPSLTGRRSLYISQKIRAGDVLGPHNIKSVRPAFGLSPKFFNMVLGKRALVDLQPGERLTANVIQDFDASLD